MDESVVREAPGVLREIAREAGAVARLTRLRPGARLGEHVHEHPYLSLHLLGGYGEVGEGGEIWIDGPSAAFHPAGSAHADHIGRRGLTTVVVEFDGGWLAHSLGGRRLPDRSVYWRGGRVGAGSARLARSCLEQKGAERSIGAALAFLGEALNDNGAGDAPPWLVRLDAIIEADPDARPAALGRELGVSEAWLARAYRARRGEGLAERRRRRRVETAVSLLESVSGSLADVALEAGFCDQSHMNRAFVLLLGTTPAEVRRERAKGGRLS